MLFTSILFDGVKKKLKKTFSIAIILGYSNIYVPDIIAYPVFLFLFVIKGRKQILMDFEDNIILAKNT